MRLIAIADLHGNLAALDRILQAALPADLVLLGGDLTHFGTPSDAEAVVRRIEEHGVPVLAVAGNCDSAAIDRRLDELGVGLHGRGCLIDGVGFLGVSAMPPWRGTMYELTEIQIAEALERALADTAEASRRVVLAHAPPRACLVDRTQQGTNVGSTAIRAFIDRVQPALVVCGHIHEARSIEQLGATTVVNCGPARHGCFATIELNESVAVELRSILPANL